MAAPGGTGNQNAICLLFSVSMDQKQELSLATLKDLPLGGAGFMDSDLGS